MNRFLLRMRRLVDGKEIHEPTLLALALTAASLLLLLALLAGAVFATASFWLGWGLFAAVAALLAAVLFGPRLRRRQLAPPVTGRQHCLHRLRWAGAKALLVFLSSWLVLIAWSQLSPGGPMPEPATEPDGVRVLTWNILRGQEDGPPWEQNQWPARRQALAEALRHVQPDILMVQEARLGQLAFLDQTLPEYRRVGVGRDDGKSGGEHCAIYFKANRFDELDGGTFWLEEPTDTPRQPGQIVKRICTWVRLRDPVSGRIMRVYNTHQYLSAGMQMPASAIILDHIQAGDPSDLVLLGGDFNATPDAPSRRLFAEAGLRETAALAGKCEGGTYQFCGLPWRCLDGILVGPGWRLQNYAVINAKPRGLFPSDHFGVLADVTVER